MIPGIVAARRGGVVFVATTFDPAAKSSPAVLANGNTRVSNNASGTYANSRTVHPISGKRYFGFFLNYSGSAGRNTAVGVADATWAYGTASSDWIGTGNSGSAWGPGDGGTPAAIYRNGSIIASAGIIVSNLEFAVDAATRSVWMRSNGGAWIGGGDPAAGTSPTFTVPGSGALYAVATSFNTTGVVGRYIDLRAHPSNITGTAPSGFLIGLPG